MISILQLVFHFTDETLILWSVQETSKNKSWYLEFIFVVFISQVLSSKLIHSKTHDFSHYIFQRIVDNNSWGPGDAWRQGASLVCLIAREQIFGCLLGHNADLHDQTTGRTDAYEV